MVTDDLDVGHDALYLQSFGHVVRFPGSAKSTPKRENIFPWKK